MTHCGKAVRRKGNIARKKCTRASVVQEIQKVPTRHEGSKRVKDLGGGIPQYLRKRDLKKLRPESTGNLDTTFSKTTRLDCQTNCQIYCWDAEDQELDLVEGRPPPKRKKETPGRAGAGNVQVPAPTTETEREDFIRVPLETSAHKEGTVAMVGEWLPQPGKKPQEEIPSPEQIEKRRRCKRSPRKKRNGDTPLGYSGQTAFRREQCGVLLKG
jgi:hypothetical protein